MTGVRKTDAIRLGWNGVNRETRERMQREAITETDLQKMRNSIRIGDKVTWTVTDTDAGQEKNNYRRKLRLTVTGCYRNLVTAKSHSGRVYSITWVELVQQRRSP